MICFFTIKISNKQGAERSYLQNFLFNDYRFNASGLAGTYCMETVTRFRQGNIIH